MCNAIIYDVSNYNLQIMLLLLGEAYLHNIRTDKTVVKQTYQQTHILRPDQPISAPRPATLCFSHNSFITSQQLYVFHKVFAKFGSRHFKIIDGPILGQSWTNLGPSWADLVQNGSPELPLIETEHFQITGLSGFAFTLPSLCLRYAFAWPSLGLRLAFRMGGSQQL